MIYFTAHTFNCVCHCIRVMFRVLGMYNFDRHFKKLSKSDKSQKKAEFKAPKMKPMRVIQATPKAKTKILS